MKNNPLFKAYSAWEKIGCNPHVLQWIKQGVKFPLKSEEVVPFEHKNHVQDSHITFVDSEIQRLITDGSLEHCTSKPVCVSPISCIPKKNGELRLITDLRHLNSFCDPPSFKYEDIDTVISLLRPKDQLVTVDLKQGFLHVPVHVEHRSYLGIYWRGQYLRWTRLPFGHNCSPFFFAKVLRPVVTFLRKYGLRIVLYVDDFI